MLRNNIPKKNIITMMYDDIAYNPNNPTPGVIINQPNGTNVYEGVEIDYKGDDVTPAHFLKIILGDKEGMKSVGTGRVVEGGAWDTIFINFADHGGSGVLCFPNGYLYADQLNDALNTAFETARYKKMLLYIEACESGSIFEGILSDDMNILAVTAAGPRENSWGCYCYSESGDYATCLGDLFSVTWMEDIDKTFFDSIMRKKSIFNDYNEIRQHVTLSNIMVYGDFDIGYEKLSTFIGYQKKIDKPSVMSLSKTIQNKMTVSSHDVSKCTMEYALASKKLTNLRKQELQIELQKNDEMRFVIDNVFREIYLSVVKLRPKIMSDIGTFDKPEFLKLSLDMFPCYRSIVNKINENCFLVSQNSYVLKRLRIISNLCVIDKNIHGMFSNLVFKSCSRIPKNIVNVF
ncbi:Hypothetical protein CINCED_3A012616 [Cinara cedri]|nr:Hypothetical protein CINCED_3A012616 [Cinara cedri]